MDTGTWEIRARMETNVMRSRRLTDRANFTIEKKDAGWFVQFSMQHGDLQKPVCVRVDVVDDTFTALWTEYDDHLEVRLWGHYLPGLADSMKALTGFVCHRQRNLHTDPDVDSYVAVRPGGEETGR